MVLAVLKFIIALLFALAVAARGLDTGSVLLLVLAEVEKTLTLMVSAVLKLIIVISFSTLLVRRGGADVFPSRRRKRTSAWQRPSNIHNILLHPASPPWWHRCFSIKKKKENLSVAPAKHHSQYPSPPCCSATRWSATSPPWWRRCFPIKKKKENLSVATAKQHSQYPSPPS